MKDQRAERAFRESTRTVTRPAATARMERDGLGERAVPADVYWGINVRRALDNFPISGRPISIYADFIYAYACVKQAAARANAEIGVLDAYRAEMIDRACEEIKAGKLRDQLVVDIMQGGAGTSTNMNFNEVIANRALELAGHVRGEYELLDPNDHVNRSQSTNDTYPTALKIGVCISVERFVDELAMLAAAFEKKAGEFASILKIGRTQLQDAVPMTLGQEFECFAIALAEEQERFREIRRRVPAPSHP